MDIIFGTLNYLKRQHFFYGTSALHGKWLPWLSSYFIFCGVEWQWRPHRMWTTSHAQNCTQQTQQKFIILWSQVSIRYILCNNVSICVRLCMPFHIHRTYFVFIRYFSSHLKHTLKYIEHASRHTHTHTHMDGIRLLLF